MTTTNTINNLSVDLFNGPPDFPLELIFEYTEYLLSKCKVTLNKTSLVTDDDKMMYLLWAKFDKYALYTLEDVQKLNVRDEFYKMFTAEMLAKILFTSNWSYEGAYHK